MRFFYSLIIALMFSFSGVSLANENIETEVVSNGNRTNSYLGKNVRMVQQRYDVKYVGGNSSPINYTMTFYSDILAQSFIVKIINNETKETTISIQNQNDGTIGIGNEMTYIQPMLLGIGLWDMPIDIRMMNNWLNGQTQYSIEPATIDEYTENIPKNIKQGVWNIHYEDWGFIGESEQVYYGAPKSMTVSYNGKSQFEFTFIGGGVVNTSVAKNEDSMTKFFNLNN